MAVYCRIATKGQLAVDFLKEGISANDIVIYKTSPNYDSFDTKAFL